MVVKWKFSSWATALMDNPAISIKIACSFKTCDICGIVLCDKTAHLSVAFHAFYSALWYSAPVRWMDYLGKGEVITNVDLNTFVKFERKKLFVCTGKVLNPLFQLMKNGNKNKKWCIYFLFSVEMLNSFQVSLYPERAKSLPGYIVHSGPRGKFYSTVKRVI